MFSLYIIADRGVFSSDDEWLETCVAVMEAVSHERRAAVQLRVKGVPPSERHKLLLRASDGLGPLAATVILNGTLEEALALGFGGVHWPEDAIPGVPITRPLPLGFAIGASVHSLAALHHATVAGATYAAFGPVFDPGTKPVAGIGLAPLRAVVSAASIPILAIGGITPERVAPCLAAGANGVAVVTGIMRAPQPATAIGRYLAAIESARAQPIP